MPIHLHVRGAALLCAGALFLSTPAVAQSQVTISFRALNDSGQPVRDLTAADVTLKIDGKAREVRTLDLVSIDRSAPVPGPIRPAYGSNTAEDRGRDIIFVIDDESVSPGKETAVQAALRQIVARLTPSDRVGVLSLRTGGTTIAASTDRGPVTNAIDEFKGQAGVNESLPDLQCRTGQILQSIKDLLANATHAKTTFVVVSTGIAPVPNDQVRTTVGRSSLCQLRASDFSDVGLAAKNSPAAMYVLYALDGRDSASSDAQAGLENLAGVTGARLIRIAGATTSGVDRIADETAAHYVAAFEVEPGERNGSAHKVEVRVNRSGVKMLAPGSIVLTKAGGRSVKDMIRTTDQFGELPLRATAWPMREPGAKVKVIALFEPSEPGVKLASAMIALVNGNKIVAQWTAQSAELERTPVIAALLSPPGNYRLRVAATAADGRAGAVDYPVQAHLTPAGPVTMSGLALGVPDNGFKPRVLFAASDAAAMGYVELYGVPKGAQVTATTELAASEDAPALGTTPASVQSATAEDMRIIAGGFSMGNLQPGNYVMRMVISIDGKVAGTAMRTMAKSK